jgi:putrescine transport system substrate-binding protein
MARGIAIGLLVLLLPGCADPDAGPELRVYNWSDYIAPDTVARFEAETGIRVTYDVFDSNEVLEGKLLTGAAGYDVVVPTSDFMGRQILAGVFQPLDFERLPNRRNLDAGLMGVIAGFDPDNRYGVPYLWGTTGFGYNIDQVRAALGDSAPVDSFDLLLQPEYMSRLADCGVAFLDAPSEIFAAVLNYLGLDPNSTVVEDYQKQARELLEAVRPYVRYFHSSQYINDLANGDICVAFGWSGDILQARDRALEAGNGVRIAYTIPREGALMWFDMLAIPADARNVDNAHRFIDFLLRPDVIAEVTDYVKYANANAAATALLPAEISADPAIYPPGEVRERLFTSKVTPPKIDRIKNRVWTAVKTGR